MCAAYEISFGCFIIAMTHWMTFVKSFELDYVLFIAHKRDTLLILLILPFLFMLWPKLSTDC